MSNLSKHKNLILITIDSLRADYLSCYGHHKRTSPNIDRLAHDGILFLNCYANSCVTFPSFISIFTSIYPSIYLPIYNNIIVTLPEVIKCKGFKTIGIHCNPFLSNKIFRKGFDVFKDMYYESTGVVSSFATPLKSRLLNIIIEKIHKYIKKYPVLYKWFSILYNLYVLNENKDKVDGVEIIKEATKEIEKVDTCPFFLWLHFMDVHYRYNTPRNVFESTIGKKYPSLFRRASIFSKMRFARLSNKEREVLINLYESSIRYVDICIGILLRYLIRKNLLQETCIIITSDHGEEFNEHGSYGHFKPKLYNEMLRVPLIIYNGGYSRKIIYRLVSLIDLGPTILDILGIKCPTNFFGDSLIPLINNSSILIKPVISEYKNDKLSLIINRYKALYEADKSILDIYDLKVDPYERTPITDNKLKETFNTKIIEYLELRKNIKRNMLRKLLNTTKISMSSKKIENV